MPTGYTANVKSGELTEFRDFALQCARAFGACVTMRDEPDDVPIPEFVVDTFHPQQVALAKAALASFRAKTDDELRQMLAREVQESRKKAKAVIAEDKEVRRRYEAMLAKVEAWTPPSKDHVELKAFMLKQLRDSVKFDCGSSSSREFLEEKTPEFRTWKNERLGKLLGRVARAEKSLAEEEERVASRNRWVLQLRESLE